METLTELNVKSGQYEHLERDELIALLEKKDDEIISLSNQVNFVSEKLDATLMENDSLLSNNQMIQAELSVLKMKTKNYLSFISWDATEFKSELQEDPSVELANELRKANSVNANNSVAISSLITEVHKLERVTEKQASIIRAYKQLTKNQEEAMRDLYSLADRIILSINPEETTEDQELLISQFRLSYSRDEDNSDVENILMCEDDLSTPRLIYSPKQETNTNSFTLTSFLHYVSAALSTLPLPHGVNGITLGEEGLAKLKSELSIYLERVCSVLENGPRVNQWLPDHVFSSCPDCQLIFSSLNRRHHCRWCGRAVCSGCSTHRISWSLIGQKQRLCDKCNLLYQTLSSALCNDNEMFD